MPDYLQGIHKSPLFFRCQPLCPRGWFLYPTIPDKIFGAKWTKSCTVKLNRKKSWVYICFCMFYFQFPFTCGESDLYQNIVKFQNMTRTSFCFHVFQSFFALDDYIVIFLGIFIWRSVQAEKKLGWGWGWGSKWLFFGQFRGEWRTLGQEWPIRI